MADAEALYRRVLAAAPRHAEAKRLLGVLHFQKGEVARAEVLLRESIAIDPNNAAAHDCLAFVLHALKRSEEALMSLRRAVDAAPGSSGYLANLGSLLIELHRVPEALDALRRAVAVDPRNSTLHNQLVAELLKAGDARGALADIDACIADGQVSTGIFAHKAIALTEIGAKAELARLVDLERLVVCRHIGETHGHPTLAAFNAALVQQISASSTLHDEVTTVNGRDTSNDLFSLPAPCIVALRRFICDEIEARRRSLPGNAHPFTLMAPQRWQFGGSWGVKMWRLGHQVTHIHPKAWLSGVYYVQLPEIVRPDQTGPDGWIEFGRGPAELYATTQPVTRLIQPVEGMLITFPSYVWHRTIPFEAARERISIAFDVTPAA